MSARIDSFYVVTETAGSLLVYTSAGGISEEPYLKSGTKFALQVEVRNLDPAVPLYIIPKARIKGRWYERRFEERIPINDVAFTYLPTRTLINGYAEPIWIEMGNRDERIQVEAWVGNRRQERIEFWIHVGPTAEEEVSIFGMLPFQEKIDW